MTALAVQEAHCFPATDHNARRFDRIAITSVFGDPMSRSTWSAAPYNLARGLQRLGVAVEGIHSGLPRGEQRLLAVHYLLNGYGRPGCTEQVIRMRIARRRAAANLAATLKCRRISNALHTGTLDLPSSDNDGIRHFLYCDHSWALSLPYRPDLNRYTPSAIAAFEDLERESPGLRRACIHIRRLCKAEPDRPLRAVAIPRHRGRFRHGTDRTFHPHQTLRPLAASVCRQAYVPGKRRQASGRCLPSCASAAARSDTGHCRRPPQSQLHSRPPEIRFHDHLPGANCSGCSASPAFSSSRC